MCAMYYRLIINFYDDVLKDMNNDEINLLIQQLNKTSTSQK